MTNIVIDEMLSTAGYLTKILGVYSSHLMSEGKNVLGTGFYRKAINIDTIDDSFSDEVSVPFLVYSPKDYERIERASISSLEDLSFSSEFFELGDVGTIRGSVAKDRLMLSRNAPDVSSEYRREKNSEMIMFGEKRDDNFYKGLWGYRDGEWQGDFYFVFDISAPFTFDGLPINNK